MFFAKIPRHTRQNAITEGDLECILARNCEGTEQLHFLDIIKDQICCRFKIYVAGIDHQIIIERISPGSSGIIIIQVYKEEPRWHSRSRNRI